MSHITIVCATTESKSSKSRSHVLPKIMQVLGSAPFECHYGPAQNGLKTLEKHKLALSSALSCATNHVKVELIFIIPDTVEYDHLEELIMQAQQDGITASTIKKSELQKLQTMKGISLQLRAMLNGSANTGIPLNCGD